ncbi:hypothetical protein ACQEVF_32435 [Nonomuraea polychroma]|uniref:hypothetical protein n=1 Tax=Nonomuraea polychroma TaxID=46176 RepID=UPI003D8DC524
MGRPAREDLRRDHPHGPKKLVELCRLLVDHEEDVEADLARFYPRDADQLGEFWDGRMSWRRLWVLVSRLPRESATVIADLGPDLAAWTNEVELLAKAVDELTEANWLFRSAHRGRGPAPPPPDPISRPIEKSDDPGG